MNFGESDEAKTRQSNDYQDRSRRVFELLREAISPGSDDQPPTDFKLGGALFQAHALNNGGDIEYQITLKNLAWMRLTRVRRDWRSVQPEVVARDVFEAYRELVRNSSPAE